MARKGSSNPISLFSFQDIITSLTGIMFLVVLMLTLSLVDQPESSGETAIDAQEISQKKKLKKAIEAEKKQLARLTEELEKLQKIPLEALEARYRRLQQELEELRRQEQICRQTEQRILLQIESENRETRQLDESKRQLQNRISELKKELAKEQAALEKSKKQLSELRKLVRFRVVDPTEGVPLLAECGENTLRLKVPGEGKRLSLNVGSAAYPEFRQQLFDWLDEFPATTYYLCIFVKPGGYRYLGSFCEELRKNHFDYGLEPLPDEASTVFESGKDAEK